MSSIASLADALRSVAVSGMKPKDLIAAVRERYPEASKKEIVRAAFYALTESKGSDPAQTESLHSFAIGERAADEEPAATSSKRPRKKKPRKIESAEQTAH